MEFSYIKNQLVKLIKVSFFRYRNLKMQSMYSQYMRTDYTFMLKCKDT